MDVKIRYMPFLIPSFAHAQVVLPNTIWVRKGVVLGPELLAHEYVHILQQRRYGILGYWIRYLRLLIRNGYQNHPMEIEARWKAHLYIEQARDYLNW